MTVTPAVCCVIFSLGTPKIMPIHKQKDMKKSQSDPTFRLLICCRARNGPSRNLYSLAEPPIVRPGPGSRMTYLRVYGQVCAPFSPLIELFHSRIFFEHHCSSTCHCAIHQGSRRITSRKGRRKCNLAPHSHRSSVELETDHQELAE